MDLPKVTPDKENSDNKRSPAKSPSSMFQQRESVSNSGGKKSKRRPSLLESNPLTILSPAAKRQRQEIPNNERGDPVILPDYLMLDSSHQEHLGSCFVEDLIQLFLVQGCRAAQSLHDFAASHDGTGQSQRLDAATVMSAKMLSGCTRLLFSLRELETKASVATAAADDQMRADENPLLDFFSECWKSLSFVLLKAEREKDSRWGLLSEIGINCGLHHLHESSLGRNAGFGSAFRLCWSNFCNAQALSNTLDDPEQTGPNQAISEDNTCQGPCRDVVHALAIDDFGHSSFGSSICVCSLASPEEGFLKRDCDLLMVTALSMEARSVNLL